MADLPLLVVFSALEQRSISHTVVQSEENT